MSYQAVKGPSNVPKGVLKSHHPYTGGVYLDTGYCSGRNNYQHSVEVLLRCMILCNVVKNLEPNIITQIPLQ